jgi:hypothetical protein
LCSTINCRYGDLLPNNEGVFIYVKDYDISENIFDVELPECENPRIELEGGFLISFLPPTEMASTVAASDSLSADQSSAFTKGPGAHGRRLVPREDPVLSPDGDGATTVGTCGLLCPPLGSISAFSPQGRPDRSSNESKFNEAEVESRGEINARNSDGPDSPTMEPYASMKSFSRDRIHVTATFRIDPKLNFLPDWM